MFIDLILKKFGNEYQIVIAPGPNEISETKNINAISILKDSNALNISELASFVGLGKSFQIWSPKNFSIHQQKNRLRAREQGATLRIIASSTERT